MIPAKELATMKTTMYGEDAVDIYLAYSSMIINVIQAAKYGEKKYEVYGEEYYGEDTPESSYVLDAFRDSGYFIEKKCMFNIDGECQYSTVISWE